MKAARDLVAVVVEFPAGMQHRQRDFSGRLPARMEIDRDAAAVVDDRDGVVDVDGDVDLVAEPGERLVDRVVDDLVDEMVQPRRAGRADVHGRTLADGFEPLENLDLVRAVVVGAGGAVAVRAHRSAGRGVRLLSRSSFGCCCCSVFSTRIPVVRSSSA